MRQAERRVAPRLHVARPRDARGDFAAAFRGRRQDQIGSGDGRHLDVQIDAVDQRAGQPRLIVGGAAHVRAALAGEARLADARPQRHGFIAATSMKRAG